MFLSSFLLLSCSKKEGCTLIGACNYDMNAACEDGSCEFDIELSLNFEVDSATLQIGISVGDTVITNPGSFLVITPSPNGCDSIISVTIELQDLNRVSEFTQLGFNIWPNPASSYLNISSPDWTPISVDIMDALGRTVWSGSWAQQISLTTLSSGMYALRISDGQNSDMKRFEVVR